MSAPYYVWIDHAGDHRHIDCESLTEAIAVASRVPPKRYQVVTVCGDGAEGGYGDYGSQWWDGLSEDERERVEAAGL